MFMNQESFLYHAQQDIIVTKTQITIHNNTSTTIWIWKLIATIYGIDMIIFKIISHIYIKQQY